MADTTESKLARSCEMDDLVSNIQNLNIVVSSNFRAFVERTSHIQETKELLNKIGQNLRLSFENWPTAEEAQMLFQINIQNAKRRSVKWSDSDKKLFYWIVIRYYLSKDILDSKQLSPEEWREIARMVIGRNAHQCRLKWEQKYKISLSDAPWTEEEDMLLQQVHDEFSKLGKENKWSQIAREIYKRSPNKVFRQPKQCRERWINKLDPNISNDPWTKQQEIDLLKTILIRGKKWSELSALYGRVRTENALKNKFNSLLKKEKLKYEFETINPQLFAKVQKLRMDYAKRYGKITPIEEIDNYEWQFIVLAIQGLYIDLCVSEGKYQEAQKIKNDDFFDLFQNEALTDSKEEPQYKTVLNLRRIDQAFHVENEKSGLVIFNPKTKKLFITPYNTLDFQQTVLRQLFRPVKQEDTSKSTLGASDNVLMRSVEEAQRRSVQPVYFFPNQLNQLLMPLGSSIVNSYWLPPVLPQQMGQNVNSYQQQQQKIQNQVAAEIEQNHVIEDLFGQDIKVVDSDQEK